MPQGYGNRIKVLPLIYFFFNLVVMCVSDQNGKKTVIIFGRFTLAVQLRVRLKLLDFCFLAGFIITKKGRQRLILFWTLGSMGVFSIFYVLIVLF
jgi:hypothetical protein